MIGAAAAAPSILVVPALLIFYVSTAHTQQEEVQFKKRPTVAMCTVARDVQEDIAEHVAYHKFIGFSKYFLLDHCSRPSLFNSIETYIQEGFVDYRYHCDAPSSSPPQKNQIQLKMFTRCLRAAAGQVDFVALFDADEYLILNKHSNVSELMASYGDIGALAVNWWVFGTSGHVLRPDGGILANYDKCTPNKHVKLIVNTKYVLHEDLNVRGPNVHNLLLTHGKKIVDENGRRVGGHETAQHSSKVVALHHYYTRSLQDWLARARRGNFSLGKASKKVFTLDRIRAIDSSKNQTCTRGQELAKQMRQVMPEASAAFGSQ